MTLVVQRRDAPIVPDQPALERFRHYDGTTYHERSQLKPAPFENPVVGAYIFIAGLAGAAAILSALAGATRQPSLRKAEQRGRYLAMLAPVVGAPLLIYDLRTPKRFYNMLRLAKPTSPMSIGTWILMGFSASATLSAAAQAAADLTGEDRRLQGFARLAAVPAAIAGAGLSTYTASLMSATSTPVWAAAPQALAVRYGASSVASAAAALTLAEDDPSARGKLEAIQVGALAVEGLAGAVSQCAYRSKGVEPAFEGTYGTAEKIGAKAIGVLLPLGLLVAGAFLKKRRRSLSTAAAISTLVGSAALRITMLGVGDQSAARPDVSFRFSTPANLPPQDGR
jgi:formate-dependent nitrite reductase membrane component NrfD